MVYLLCSCDVLILLEMAEKISHFVGLQKSIDIFVSSFLRFRALNKIAKCSIASTIRSAIAAAPVVVHLAAARHGAVFHLLSNSWTDAEQHGTFDVWRSASVSHRRHGTTPVETVVQINDHHRFFLPGLRVWIRNRTAYLSPPPSRSISHRSTIMEVGKQLKKTNKKDRMDLRSGREIDPISSTEANDPPTNSALADLALKSLVLRSHLFQSQSQPIYKAVLAMDRCSSTIHSRCFAKKNQWN